MNVINLPLTAHITYLYKFKMGAHVKKVDNIL